MPKSFYNRNKETGTFLFCCCYLLIMVLMVNGYLLLLKDAIAFLVPLPIFGQSSPYRASYLCYIDANSLCNRLGKFSSGDKRALGDFRLQLFGHLCIFACPGSLGDIFYLGVEFHLYTTYGFDSFNFCH